MGAEKEEKKPREEFGAHPCLATPPGLAGEGVPCGAPPMLSRDKVSRLFLLPAFIPPLTPPRATSQLREDAKGWLQGVSSFAGEEGGDRISPPLCRWDFSSWLGWERKEQLSPWMVPKSPLLLSLWSSSYALWVLLGPVGEGKSSAAPLEGKILFGGRKKSKQQRNLAKKRC